MITGKITQKLALLLSGFALLGTLARADDSIANAQAPARIIATSPSNTEIICALGASERLVAVSSYATYPPEILDLPKIGGLIDPDMESILTLAPDLLVMRGINPHVEKLCRDHDIRIYQDKTDTLETLYTTIGELGEILDRKPAAKKLIEDTRKHLKRIEQAASKRHHPTVLLTLRSPDKLGGITTVSNKSYLGQVIELSGGKNIFADHAAPYPQVSLEDIVSMQPDIIIEAMPGEKNAEALQQQLLKQWRDLGNIQAGDRGTVVVLTEDYVLIPSPRVVQLADRLQAIFNSADKASASE